MLDLAQENTVSRETSNQRDFVSLSSPLSQSSDTTSAGAVIFYAVFAAECARLIREPMSSGM